MKKIIVNLLAIVVCLVGLSACSEDRLGKVIAWKSYKGTIPGYEVKIDEEETEYKQFLFTSKVQRMIVHLNVISDNGTADSSQWITGHSAMMDYRGPDSWHTIFYCGYPKKNFGCNSVEKNGIGTWEFEPCPADKDEVKPFTKKEIDFALNKLDEAMKAIYNEKHATDNLEAQKKRHKE